MKTEGSFFFADLEHSEVEGLNPDRFGRWDRESSASARLWISKLEGAAKVNCEKNFIFFVYLTEAAFDC